MIVDVVAAGGKLNVEAAEDGYWEGLVSSAVRHGKVPEGELLSIRHGKGWSARVITLEDPPAWMPAILDPIPVGKRLRNPHSAVEALRADPERLPVRSATRGRALRLLDALAKAATKRGYQIQAPKPGDGYGPARGCLQVSIHGYANAVDLVELCTTGYPTTATA